MSSGRLSPRDPVNAPWPHDEHDSRLTFDQPTVTQYGADIPRYRFVSGGNLTTRRNSETVERIVSRIPAGGVCNILVCRGKTSLHGSADSLNDQRDLIGEVWAKLKNSASPSSPPRFAAATTAGFYINHPNYQRYDYNQPFLQGAEHFGHPVGLTSLGPAHFPLPPSIAHLYSVLHLDHGFLHLPKLDGRFPSTDATPPSKINTPAGYLTYRALSTASRSPIPHPLNADRAAFDAFYNEVLARRPRDSQPASTVSLDADLEGFAERGQCPLVQADGVIVKVAEHPRTDRAIRSAHSYTGGGLAHGDERNERQMLVRVKNNNKDRVTTVVHVALTVPPEDGGGSGGRKRNGWTLNEAFLLAREAVQWRGYRLEDDDDDDDDDETGESSVEVYNTDGGPSVLIAVLGSDGSAQLIAKGGERDGAGGEPRRWDSATNWRSANAVVVTGLER